MNVVSRCVANWPQLLRRVNDALKPGAYFEIQENAIWDWTNDGFLRAKCPFMAYLKAIYQGARLQETELNVYDKVRQWIIDAGFDDVQQSTYFLPYSP